MTTEQKLAVEIMCLVKGGLLKMPEDPDAESRKKVAALMKSKAPWDCGKRGRRLDRSRRSVYTRRAKRQRDDWRILCLN